MLTTYAELGVPLVEVVTDAEYIGLAFRRACDRLGIREDRDLVLSTRNGRPVGQRNAHRSWTRLLKQAGVEHHGIHRVPHANATMLAEEGVHERVAQYLLGHADSQMTRVVSPVTGSMIERVGEAVERSAGRYLSTRREAATPTPHGPPDLTYRVGTAPRVAGQSDQSWGLAQIVR